MKRIDVNEFDRALDDCLDRVARGETVAQCLALYPEHAFRLEPLLRVSETARTAFAFEPSAHGINQARARMDSARSARALEQQSHRRAPSLIERLFARRLPAAAIASIAVIALTAVLLVRPALGPDGTPSIPSSQPSGSTEQQGEQGQTPGESSPDEQPQEPPVEIPPAMPPALEKGNFAFYVSDQPNDIGNFQSLIVTVSHVELKPHDDDEDSPTVFLSPVQSTADLVALQGDRALELWRGDIPRGDYVTVSLKIESIEGVLASSGETVEVTLPSGTLHLDSSFSIHEHDAVEFVFDITVHKTGGESSHARYILLPQASESGVGRAIEPVQPQEKAEGDAGDKPGKGGDDAPHVAPTPPEARPGPHNPDPQNET